MEKRKAAKEVFREQQIIEPEEIVDELEEVLDYDESNIDIQAQASMPAPAPAFNAGFSPESTPSIQRSKKAMPPKPKNYVPNLDIKSSEEMQLEKDPVQVKINGFWFWKRVIIPPNAYVVHTRLNKKDPITLGLGVSFRYNPYKDAYIVIPAAMQTIGVVANCITKEKQGINVLAYVQWQIHDFSVAYKKLDLTNSRDPLGIVNAQLREQAEAAIKDKIATMSVEEVLTDKALIIEELTSRLSRVAEGQEGLGIKIITVQIREAVVSSSSLWNDLQAPFRNEERKKARISQLEMENEINRKELETRKWKETREAETNFEIEATKQKKYTETVELKLKQETLRFEEEQKSLQKKQVMEEETEKRARELEDERISHSRELLLKQELEDIKRNDKKKEEEEKIHLEAEKRNLLLETERNLFEIKEKARLEEENQSIEIQRMERETILAEKESALNLLLKKQENELELLKLQAMEKQKEIELNIKEKENNLSVRLEKALVEIFKIRQEINNSINANQLTKELIERLPEIAERMPKPDELKIFQSGESDPFFESLTSFLQKILSVSEFLKESKKV